MGYKDTSQSQVMQAHMASCKLSGLTVAAYCSQHQIKVHQYHYWRKKLQPQERGKFISIAPPLSNTPVSIIFTNGNRISFETMPPIEYVKQLMA